VGNWSRNCWLTGWKSSGQPLENLLVNSGKAAGKVVNCFNNYFDSWPFRQRLVSLLVSLLALRTSGFGGDFGGGFGGVFNDWRLLELVVSATGSFENLVVSLLVVSVVFSTTGGFENWPFRQRMFSATGGLENCWFRSCFR
jgi:hypothetical protein